MYGHLTLKSVLSSFFIISFFFTALKWTSDKNCHLSNAECVSMHDCEYCDGNDDLLSGIIKGEFRTILYQIGDF